MKEIIRLLENELGQNDDLYKDLGIIDREISISLSNAMVPPTMNNLIPFISTCKLVQLYEEKNLRDYILSSIIPLKEFHRKISKKSSANDLIKRDLLLMELLRWFKEEFFTWFDGATCERCRTAMQFLQYTQPTSEERQMGHASRVELYR